MENTPGQPHILAAKEAPVAVILRRKPSKVWHVMLWNLHDDSIVHGSWFTGRLYPLRCDLSWDGKYMSYLARGANASTTWNGICEPPFLKTLVEWDNLGSWNGGAVWLGRHRIGRNLSILSEPKLMGAWPPKTTFEPLNSFRHEDPSIIYHRFYRDGFRPIIDGRIFEPFDKEGLWRDFRATEENVVWRCPSLRGDLVLTAEYVGYKYRRGFKRTHGRFGEKGGPGFKDRTGYIFRFEIEGLPDLLGPTIEWATWAWNGDLLYSVQGSAFRLKKPRKGELGEPVQIDFTDLVKPARSQPI